MKKVHFLVVMLVFSITAIQAKPIDRNIALTAAQKFATAQFAMERAMPELVYTGQNEEYYVFNLNDHSFVIIAGDDAHRPVIGYSDESAFDASNIPPALSYYLDGVTECMLQLHQAVATPDVAQLLLPRRPGWIGRSCHRGLSCHSHVAIDAFLGQSCPRHW